MSGRSRHIPESTEISEPFWDGTRIRELWLQWCVRCHGHVHPPRSRCPKCLGVTFEWREASGGGTVYAVTVVDHPTGLGPEGDRPFAVALVELNEGVRMLSNVTSATAEPIAVGTRVKVAWEPLPDGRHLPVFEAVT